MTDEQAKALSELQHKQKHLLDSMLKDLLQDRQWLLARRGERRFRDGYAQCMADLKAKVEAKPRWIQWLLRVLGVWGGAK